MNPLALKIINKILALTQVGLDPKWQLWQPVIYSYDRTNKIVLPIRWRQL